MGGNEGSVGEVAVSRGWTGGRSEGDVRAVVYDSGEEMVGGGQQELDLWNVRERVWDPGRRSSDQETGEMAIDGDFQPTRRT